MSSTLRANIADLRRRAERDAERASWSDRIADAITRFAGSMPFVGLHAVAYAFWIAANLGWVPGVPRFDRSFVVLAMEASVEAIFLSTFVLISQNRMAALADARAKLDLHINLLAEHELTRLADHVVRIGEHLGVASDDPALHEIRHDVEPERVLDALHEDEARSGG